MPSVKHIPFHFATDDLISYIRDENSTAPNIVLGGGIKNLITFYQMAKAGLIANVLKNEAATGGAKPFGELDKFDITKLTIEEGGKDMFAPYKVTLDTTEVKEVSFKDGEYEKIGFIKVQEITNLFMGGNNTTRKGGRRRRKARGRKTPKRRVKKSKK